MYHSQCRYVVTYLVLNALSHLTTTLSTARPWNTIMRMMLNTPNKQLGRMKYTVCVDYLVDTESLRLRENKMDSML